ncbi:flavin-containing monooxygenase [Parvularcula marina]|uniref:NAD(P)/FAD-dependent oxidoreductase n=1 Tax=Parvularcula marina TaxID=2292771 RepID=A0A371RKR1_9PROT|nr:NAD(P)/FAD-dependent oxidoreductase [Parvularcula marina]RFB06048.1 NAD(P)/FAD-dependent oxidoreductase [Parvularcula marina]
MATLNQQETLDVLIIGAGLSGIGAACRLKMHCPEERFEIFEARERMGGTWDLFRYPGVRSDSDMYTLGYPFRPWPDSQPIADGDIIRDYINETAAEYGVDGLIRYGREVTGASWSSDRQLWTVSYRENGQDGQITCRFLLACAGYYDYAEGHAPDFPGKDAFGGQILHPQFWPEDFSAEGKKIIVIGSGATAITVVPALAEHAEHVTMLQRSPSDVVPRIAEDGFARTVGRLPAKKFAGSLIRWRSILLSIVQYGFARWKPDFARKSIKKIAQEEAGPNVDAEIAFSPRYNVWDQRVCLDPDSVFFRSLKEGRASIVTNQIEKLDETGVLLADGTHLVADAVVTATGLKIKLFGGIALTVDGEKLNFADRLIYKGMMIEGAPNFAFCFGYTNASWTLKADLSARHVCRILNRIRKKGYGVCRPDTPPEPRETVPLIHFNSGYIERAANVLPKQGVKAPWRVHQNYLADLSAYQFGQVEDGVLKFEPATRITEGIPQGTPADASA